MMNTTIKTGFIRVWLLALLLLSPTGPLPAKFDPAAYLLNNDDVVFVSVREEPSASAEYRIGIDGMVTLPLVGAVRASGLTMAALETRLTEMYGKYFVTPHVAVALKKINLGSIYISGEVEKTGEVRLESGLTLAQLLVTQKTRKSTADLKKIRVLRADGIQEIDFEKFLDGKNDDGNLVLAANDIVYVPELKKPEEPLVLPIGTVLVTGEVLKTGSYEIYSHTRLLDILTLAGWDKKTANLSRVIILTRGGAKTVLDIYQVLKGQDMTANVSLKPDDTLIVPGFEETDMKVTVVGAVAKPGVFRLTDPAGIRVKEALLLAENYIPSANLTGAVIIRDNGTREMVDLESLLFSGDSTQDISIRAGDTLLVPEKKLVRVYVLGMVNKPGLYSIYESMNIFQALTFAHQPTFGASLGQTRIIRGWPDNPKVIRVNLKKILAGNLKDEIMLEDRDVLYVPETVVSDSLDFWQRLLGRLPGTYPPGPGTPDDRPAAPAAPK